MTISPDEKRDWHQLVEEIKELYHQLEQTRIALINIQNNCEHTNLPKRTLGEQYSDICPDCGKAFYAYYL